MRTVWTNKEIAILKKNRKLDNKDLVQLFPNKTLKQILLKRNRAGIRKKDFWSDDEDKKLIELAKTLHLKEIYKKFSNRKEYSVKTRYYKLNLRYQKPFPKYIAERYFKKDNHGKDLSEFKYNQSKEVINLRCLDCNEVNTRVMAYLLASYEKNGKIQCDYCSGRKVSKQKSLKFHYPNISKAFDAKKNKFSSDQIIYKSAKRVWFKCNNGHSNKLLLYTVTHVYDPKIKEKFKYKKRSKKLDFFVCPDCVKNPLIIEDERFKHNIHPTLNDKKFISKLRVSSSKKVVWQCSNNSEHHWEQSPYNIYRNFKKKPDYTLSNSCHYCLNITINEKNSFQDNKPQLLKYIDKKVHTKVDFSKVFVGSTELYSFRCVKFGHHKWQMSLRDISSIKGNPCPHCRKDYRNPKNIKIFLESIKDDLPYLTEQQKWLFFQQSGLLDFKGKLYNLSKAIITNRFPLSEVQKYIEDKPSLVDDFISDKTLTGEDINTQEEYFIDDTKGDDIETKTEEVAEVEIIDDDPYKDLIPELKSKNLLKALDNTFAKVHSDSEAIDFLITSGKHKLWDDVFLREKEALKEIESFKGGKYVSEIKKSFFEEYEDATKLKIPKEYSFKINGQLTQPLLMQKLVASRIIKEKRVGNFSGTGAGKTLSAILASRISNSRLTIITCPNSVVSNWEKNIKAIFNDSIVSSKKIDPILSNAKKNKFLILNYEYFQQPESAEKVKQIIDLGDTDMVIVDEIHYAKQRVAENVSKRKEMIKNLIVELGSNKNLKVLGMSATPVINNLFEGKTMIELITGKVHDDLETKANIPNCMKIYQTLSRLGIRQIPNYAMQLTQKEIEIDCTEYLEEIKEKVSKRNILKLEQILTKAKLNTIIENIENKTIIYTHYIDGIGELLKEKIEQSGFTVGMYTGADKTGLEEFIEGDLDVLIGTSAIGTGVDGLQNVCKKMIVNILPWTNAEFEQLKGRIFRQGQKRDVEIIVPVTEIEINGEKKSWCKNRLSRIKYKKTVADAAVDGIIPEEYFRTEYQAIQDLGKWIERVSNEENIYEIERRNLVSSLFVNDEKVQNKRIRKYGDFSRLNARWNNSLSNVLHSRLSKNNEEWVHYHEEYRKAREKWSKVPYMEIAKRYKNRSGLSIGDMGCGEALLYEELKGDHKVFSFDHVGINENVIQCDVSNTPLNDDFLDVVVFSLSLMGKNIKDYLIEANRILKLDGRIHIIEPKSKFKDLENFKAQLGRIGFEFITSEEMWKFIHITGQKSANKVIKDVIIKF